MPVSLKRVAVDWDLDGPGRHRIDLGDVNLHTAETLTAALVACSQAAPDQWLIAAFRDEVYADGLVTVSAGIAEAFTILHFDDTQSGPRDLLDTDASPMIAWSAPPVAGYAEWFELAPGQLTFPFEFADEAELRGFATRVAELRDLRAVPSFRAQVAYASGERFVVTCAGPSIQITPARTVVFFGLEQIPDRLHLWRDLWGQKHRRV